MQVPYLGQQECTAFGSSLRVNEFIRDAILEARKSDGGLKVDAEFAKWWVSRGSKGLGQKQFD
jgi:hypothetical protein